MGKATPLEADYFLSRESVHFLVFLLKYILVPHRPALLPAFLPLLRLPFLIPFFFFSLTEWINVSVPGCEPGPAKVAACSSASGENAMAIATAKAAIRVFLMCMSDYLPFPVPASSAIPQLHASRRNFAIAPFPVRDTP